MAGDFIARTQELLGRVGGGDLTGQVTVDQVYAKYQHEGLELNHPGGGEAKYLERPLLEKSADYLRRLSAGVLDPEGLTPAMVRVAEDLAGGVYERAPFEFGDLRASAHPTVDDDGDTVYDRAPMVHRLTKEELRIKHELHDLGLGN